MVLRSLKNSNNTPTHKTKTARAMREEGKTLQQIADELGYKSVGSVHYVLNKNQIFNFSKTL